MTERDAGSVAALAGQLGYPSTPEQIRERFAILSRDPDSATFVGEDESGRVVGWAHVTGRRQLESEPYAELAGLVVDASARRKGAGQALVSSAEAWAKGRGYPSMRVRSNVKRAEARPFYEGIGYVIGKTQNVYLKELT